MKEARISERAVVKQSSIGDGSTVDHDSVILKSVLGTNVDIEKRNLIRDAVIGDMTYTGADTSIMWAEVGKYCCISRLVDIGGNEHDYHAVSMMPAYRLESRLGGKLKKHPDEEKIKIGNDVWIGAGAIVVRKEGLEIGNGAVLGAVGGVNAGNCMERLLEMGVIPIVNENDTVAIDELELEIGENDSLAAIVAGLVHADLLVLMSDIDGLYSADPHQDEDAELIPVVTEIDSFIESIAGGAGTPNARGGMATKIAAACSDR